MKKIISYVSEDGKIFNNYEDCIKYESQLKPIVIESSSLILSKTIFDDEECKDWTSEQWNEYLNNLSKDNNILYDLLANEEYEKIGEIFDYYRLGDLIYLIDKMKIVVK